MNKQTFKIVLWYFALFCIGMLGVIKCEAQTKQEWEVAELVSMEGISMKKWNSKITTTFVDSILIISSSDTKIITLISNAQQGFFDDSGYRVFKLSSNDPIQSMKDTVGTIYRRVYDSPFFNKKIIVMVDDMGDFIMIHPNAQVGIVFHNKKKK